MLRLKDLSTRDSQFHVRTARLEATLAQKLDELSQKDTLVRELEERIGTESAHELRAQLSQKLNEAHQLQADGERLQMDARELQSAKQRLERELEAKQQRVALLEQQTSGVDEKLTDQTRQLASMTDELVKTRQLYEHELYRGRVLEKKMATIEEEYELMKHTLDMSEQATAGKASSLDAQTQKLEEAYQVINAQTLDLECQQKEIRDLREHKKKSVEEFRSKIRHLEELLSQRDQMLRLVQKTSLQYCIYGVTNCIRYLTGSIVGCPTIVHYLTRTSSRGCTL